MKACNTVNSMIYVHKTRKEADGKRGETERERKGGKEKEGKQEEKMSKSHYKLMY